MYDVWCMMYDVWCMMYDMYVWYIYTVIVRHFEWINTRNASWCLAIVILCHPMSFYVILSSLQPYILESQVGIAQNHTITLLLKVMTCFLGSMMLCAQFVAVSSCTLHKQTFSDTPLLPLLRSEPLVLSTRHCTALSGRWPADIPQVQNLKPRI